MLYNCFLITEYNRFVVSAHTAVIEIYDAVIHFLLLFFFIGHSVYLVNNYF